MGKKYLLGGIIILVLIIAAYLLLSIRSGSPQTINQPAQTNQQTVPPLQGPMTTQNADQSLGQTDTSVQSQLDQADQDMQSVDQSEANISEEDTGTINSL